MFSAEKVPETAQCCAGAENGRRAEAWDGHQRPFRRLPANLAATRDAKSATYLLRPLAAVIAAVLNRVTIRRTAKRNIYSSEVGTNFAGTPYKST